MIPFFEQCKLFQRSWVYYEYDAIGRLRTQKNGSVQVAAFTYDAQGNVQTKTTADMAVWLYDYDEENHVVKITSPAVDSIGPNGKEKRGLITQFSYDSFGNLIEQIKDPNGLKQIIRYAYDNNNQKIKTIYPNASINKADNSASTKRQEQVQTLEEQSLYNAFGQLVASRDKAGNWKHFVYDGKANLAYQLDSKGKLTEFTYDAFGQPLTKTSYATTLTVVSPTEVSCDWISSHRQSNKNDRHEYYFYDKESRLVETRGEKLRVFNAATKKYDQLEPITKIQYNLFGEVSCTLVKIHESDWEKSYTYYDNDGQKIATINPAGYLSTFTLNAFGEVKSVCEYAQKTSKWDAETFVKPANHSQDRTVEFEYNALGQVVTKTLKNVGYQRLKATGKGYETLVGDLSSTYTYDALGHQVSVTDAQHHTTYSYYNSLGQLEATVGPSTQDGRSATTYSYDALGNLVSTKRWARGAVEANNAHFMLGGDSENDVITKAEYDAYGHLLAKTDGIQHRVEYSYDANGNLARSWETLKQNNNTPLVCDTRYSYDSENRLIQTLNFKSTGGVKTEDIQYNAFGEVIAKGINGNYNQHIEYDKAGRVWRSNAQGRYQIYVYDLKGRLTQTVSSVNNANSVIGFKGYDLSEAQYEDMAGFDYAYLQRQNQIYDALGNVEAQIRENQQGVFKQSQTFDRFGNMLSHTNANAQTTLYEYNALNQLIRQEMPKVKTVDEHGVATYINPVNLYAYDELGQAIAMTNANGNTFSKQYDAMGHLISEIDAKGNKRSKHYNLLDQLSDATNELGGITSYTYDKANRLLFVKTPKTSQAYEYDERGQLLKQRNGEGEESTFSYDNLGNQLTSTKPGNFKTSYEYDNFGHKTKVTDAKNNTQSWVYDNDGHLMEHTDLGGHRTNYGYNVNGLLVQETSTAGKNSNYFYQDDGQLVRYLDNARNEKLVYNYDNEGQLIGRQSSRGGDQNEGWCEETDTYVYDALGRLEQVKRNSAGKEIFSVGYEYDNQGNIRHTKSKSQYSKNQSDSRDDYYRYDENNRILINKGQLVNGNIGITKNQGTELQYDEAGNTLDAAHYENNYLQQFHYRYNTDNQLELIEKNHMKLQFNIYDNAGRLWKEYLFNNQNYVVQVNILTYTNGLLSNHLTKDGRGNNMFGTDFWYDNVGNLRFSRTLSNGGWSVSTHEYGYELWDTYQQKLDDVVMVGRNNKVYRASSTRFYDVNGRLKDSVDSTQRNNMHYWYSNLEGLRARSGRDGSTNFISLGGKTIGDSEVDAQGRERLHIYSGFTPKGSRIESNEPFNWRTATNPGDIADGTAAELPSESIGSYTIQAGDTLESIALAVYGDSSLWYVIADANGIIDRTAQAGGDGPLHVGQRLTIPQAASGQHYTNNTQKILSNTKLLGNISASTNIPAPKAQKHSLFAAVVTAVICTVVTVLTAGVLGAMAAGTMGINGLGALFTTGLGVLGHGAGGSLAGSLAINFAAGFAGSIASQGLSYAMGRQDKLDYQGALLSGLATAMTLGIGKGLGANSSYKDLVSKMDEFAINNVFKLSSAAEIMMQNTASQALELAAAKQSHFELDTLAVSGLTAGLLGSKLGSKIDTNLKATDHQSGFLSSYFQALTNGALKAATGTHFDVGSILGNNLGNALGSSLVQLKSQEELKTLKLLELPEELEYCPIPEEETNTPEKPQKETARTKLAEKEPKQDAKMLQKKEKPANTAGYQKVVREKITKSNYHYCDDFLSAKEIERIKKANVAFLETIEDDLHIDYSKIYNNAASGLKRAKPVPWPAIALLTKHSKGSVSVFTHYFNTPGYPGAGVVSLEIQRKSINAIIAEGKARNLGLRDIAHVLAIVRIESSFNPYAAAKDTSASGLGQFTADTEFDYKVADSKRWHMESQISAIYNYYISCKNKVNKFNLGDPYIYKMYHDGINSMGKERLNLKAIGTGLGFSLANEIVLPNRKRIEDVIRPLF